MKDLRELHDGMHRLDVDVQGLGDLLSLGDCSVDEVVVENHALFWRRSDATRFV